LLLRRGNGDEAMEQCREALAIHPADADAENNLGLALLQKGENREAAIHLKRCLEINPDHMNGQANLSWILATSPDASIRNGELAVTMTEGLLRRAGHPNAIVLRTLAAAYAEVGRFPDAIETARKAQELANRAGDAGLANDLESNIQSYQANQPLRTQR
jgi:tetratricopeptide (TPR) repeat protein